MGDFDGDGYADVAVSGVSTGRVYRGGVAGLAPQGTLAGVTVGETDAWLVAPAGDVDGDGYDDLLHSYLGAVEVHRGSAAGLDTCRVPLPPTIHAPPDPV